MDSSFADTSAYIPQDLLSTLTKERTVHRKPKGSRQPISPEQNRRIKEESASILSSLNKRNSRILTEHISYTPNKRLTSSSTSSNGSEGDNVMATAKPATRTVAKVPRSSSTSSRSSSALSTRSDLMLVNEDLPIPDQLNEIAALKARLAKVEGEKQALSVELSQRKQEKSSVMSEVQLGELKEQFATQERLLGAYQRENEKSLTELALLRNRERVMQTHLQKLHGPNWESQVFENGPTSTRTLSSSPIIRSSSEQRSPIFTSSPLPTPSIDQITSPIPSAEPKSVDQSRLIAHLQSVQLLVQGMEQRLIVAEEDMFRREKEARQEGLRARALIQNGGRA